MGPVLTPLGSISVLTLYGDNDTWSVTVFTVTGDAPLKALRHVDGFDRVVRACPSQAHWLDGAPLTGVLAMAGVLDRHPRLRRGRAAGGHRPRRGRRRVGLHEPVRRPRPERRHDARAGAAAGRAGHLDDPRRSRTVWHARTDREVAPYYWNQVRADRQRVAEMAALREGREPPAPDPTTTRFLAAARTDPDVFRGLIETVQCTALPQEVLARPVIAQRMAQLGDDPLAPLPGPDRQQLLHLLAA